MSAARVADGTDGTDGLTRRLVERGEGWWTHARCRKVGGDVVGAFFSQRPRDIARAKRVCATCPVMAPCLEGALLRHEPWGVWGGQLFHHGRILSVKRGRGRPPRLPRPEDQLPAVPIPGPLRHLAVMHGA